MEFGGITRNYAELRGIWRDYAGFGGISGIGGVRCCTPPINIFNHDSKFCKENLLHFA